MQSRCCDASSCAGEHCVCTCDRFVTIRRFHTLFPIDPQPIIAIRIFKKWHGRPARDSALLEHGRGRSAENSHHAAQRIQFAARQLELSWPRVCQSSQTALMSLPLIPSLAGDASHATNAAARSGDSPPSRRRFTAASYSRARSRRTGSQHFLQHSRIHRPRCDRIHIDSCRSQFLGKRFRQSPPAAHLLAA